MTNNRIIIILIICSTALSMLFLGYVEKRQRDANEDYWSIYFVAPFSHNDHTFVIDNKSDSDDFFYEITANENIVTSETKTVSANDRSLITVSQDLTEPLTITVTKDDQKKTIQKK